MQLEIKTEGVDFVVSRAPLPKNDNDGQQKTDRETGAPLHVTELVAMHGTGADVIKFTTSGEPKVTELGMTTPTTRITFVQAADLLAAHLEHHAVPEPVFLTVTTGWGHTEVTAQLRPDTVPHLA